MAHASVASRVARRVPPVAAVAVPGAITLPPIAAVAAPPAASATHGIDASHRTEARRVPLLPPQPLPLALGGIGVRSGGEGWGAGVR